MKFTTLIAAGLAFATLGIGAAAPAEAQRYGQQDRDHDRGDRGDRGNAHRGNDHRGNGRNDWRGNRGNDHRGYRNDDRRYGNRYGYNRHNRCRTEWRHHRRVQICR